MRMLTKPFRSCRFTVELPRGPTEVWNQSTTLLCRVRFSPSSVSFWKSAERRLPPTAALSVGRQAFENENASGISVGGSGGFPFPAAAFARGIGRRGCRSESEDESGGARQPEHGHWR